MHDQRPKPPLFLALCLGLAACSYSATEPPSVIVVSLDTLRADRLGAYGYRGGLTPNLDRFATEAVVFEDAWAQAGVTLASHASMLTGRYASELGMTDYHTPLPREVPTLAGVLRLYGYATAAATGGGFLTRDFGFDAGFDFFEVPRAWGCLYHTLPELEGWLDDHPTGPRFAFLHGYDTHTPYLKPAPYGFLHTPLRRGGKGTFLLQQGSATENVFDQIYYKAPTPEILDLSQPRLQDPATGRYRVGDDLEGEPVDEQDIDQVRGVYDGAVTWADAWFGLLMADLDSRGMLDDTVVVVLSDHGEELHEEGVFNHRYTLSDTVLHVPLMIRLPGGEGARRVAGRVGLVDLMPTLLQLAGAEAPAGLAGHSLVGALQGEPVPERPALFAEGRFHMISARSDEGRLTFTGIDVASPLLVPLLEAADVAGPAFAQSTLAAERREPLRQAMLDWRRSLHVSGGSERVSDELSRELQRHGYWEPR